MKIATSQTKISVKLPRPHAGQAQILRERKRFNVACCGRQFGKNVILREIITRAVLDRKPSAWFAPTYKGLRKDWQSINTLLSPVINWKSEQEKRLRFITGGSLDFWSLDEPDTIRGEHYALGVINEAAFVPRLTHIWNMVIRPMLARLEGEMWFAGTPKGLNGYFEIWNIAAGDGWARWQMPTSTNPHIPAGEIEIMRQSMPERTFAQEILAQFIEDGAGVFRRVMQSATAEKQDHRIEGHEYVIGADWARSEDATVFAVYDMTINAICHIDRMMNTDYAMQRLRLQALNDRFAPVSIVVEQNSIGGPQLEQLQAMELPVRGFTTSNASKAQIIDGLALALERGTISIVNDDTLVNELQAYQSERLPSGLVRYGAPDGMHDDCVMAAAIALYAGNRPSASEMVSFV